VIGLAAAFRRSVIAEGVETIEHGSMLLQLGCDHAQGYGVARPMPAADFPAWAQNWKPDVAWGNVTVASRDGLPLLFAYVEHRAWVDALVTFLREGTSDHFPHNHHPCRLGNWLETTGQEHFSEQPAYKEVAALHQQVHSFATELIALHASPERANALKHLDKLYNLRDALLERLRQLAMV
jgi:hypothetical protein